MALGNLPRHPDRLPAGQATVTFWLIISGWTCWAGLVGWLLWRLW
jgi:hypothetical protein